LSEVDELHHLRFADDEFRAALDLAILVGPAIRQRVARVIGPLDDLDELTAEEVAQGHGCSLEGGILERGTERQLRRRSERLARAQDGVRERRLVGRIREVLGFQTEAGAPGVRRTAATRDLALEIVARIELDARLGGAHLEGPA